MTIGKTGVSKREVRVFVGRDRKLLDRLPEILGRPPIPVVSAFQIGLVRFVTVGVFLGRALAFVAAYESGKVVAALCHGVALLRYTLLSSGEPLVKGKTVTGFANVEEDFADDAVRAMGALPEGKHLMPWRIEDELKKLGANFVQAGLWRGFAVRDGNLVTGQQNFSGGETAALVIETLGR